MTVLPVPVLPPLIERYTNVQAPAGLVVLAQRKLSGFGPEASLGSGMPDNKINPYSGIYDEKGHLPKIPSSGLTFMAYV